MFAKPLAYSSGQFDLRDSLDVIRRDMQDSLDQILGKVRCESVSSQSDKDTGAILYIEGYRRDVSSARAAMGFK